MRSVLFLSLMNGSAWGGSEEQWYQLALWMANHDYKIGVAVFDWEAKKQKLVTLENAGCKIYLIPNNGKGIFKTWRQEKALNDIPFSSYDLVYVNQGGWKDVAHGPFKSLYKKLPAYALSFHNYEQGANMSSGKVNILKNWIKHASVSIAATGMVFKTLEEEYSIFTKHKEVSYSPPTFEIPTVPTPYPPMQDDKTVSFLVLGALDITRKAQDVLIRVLSATQWKNRNWHLNIYGEGKDHEELQDLIIRLNLNDKIFLKGFSNDAKQCLTDCHLLIHATRFDAMPISVIEGMAMARPCLVTDIGDMAQWVESNHNGYVVEKISEEALQTQMEKAWSRRDQWAQMGANAFETFQKKYPLPFEEKFLAMLEHYYQQPNK